MNDMEEEQYCEKDMRRGILIIIGVLVLFFFIFPFFATWASA